MQGGKSSLNLLAGVALVSLTAAAPDPATRSIEPSSPPPISTRKPRRNHRPLRRLSHRAAFPRSDLERERDGRIETTFRKFDNLNYVRGAASGDAGVVTQTDLNATTRDAGRTCSQKIEALATEISLSRPIYARLKAFTPRPRRPIPASSSGAIAQYDRAGVGADEATRAKIKALQDRISENSIAFERNIADGRKEVMATSAELAGLPADYIAAHKPDGDGRVRITTDYPDLGPSCPTLRRGARRRLFEANLTRAYPANDQLLRKIFADRAELAALLGRPNYAALITEDKMIGSPANAVKFLDDIAAVVESPARRDLGKMLARLKAIDPKAASVPAWSTGYLSS